MKLYDILMVIDNSTLIRIVVAMFGMEFEAEHYADYFLGCETDELLDKRVTEMRVTEKNGLEIILENKQPKRSEMTVCRRRPPGTDDGRSRKRGAENVRKRKTDS